MVMVADFISRRNEFSANVAVRFIAEANPVLLGHPKALIVEYECHTARFQVPQLRHEPLKHVPAGVRLIGFVRHLRHVGDELEPNRTWHMMRVEAGRIPVFIMRLAERLGICIDDKWNALLVLDVLKMDLGPGWRKRKKTSRKVGARTHSLVLSQNPFEREVAETITAKEFPRSPFGGRKIHLIKILDEGIVPVPVQ